MFDFDAGIRRVGDLLARPYVIQVPAYQRSYVWTSKEAGTLLENILETMEDRSKGSYFLSYMLFLDANPQRARSRLPNWVRAPAPHVLQVIDGFQRLTTLTILLCVLRDLDSGKGETAGERVREAVGTAGAGLRPRLSLHAGDDEFFDAHVRAPGATLRAPAGEELSPAEAGIIDVRDHFVAALAGSSAGERGRLVEFLLERCCFVHVVTSDIDRAYRMFMVLNASGKLLARDDILKATLLGSLPKTAAHCVAAWDLAKVRLGSDFESFFSHIRAMFGRAGGQVIASVNAIAKEQGGAQVFVERVVEPVSRIFDDIRKCRHEGAPQSDAITQYLRYLGWHAFADWKPPLMLWWLKHGDDPGRLAHFLARLDRLAFGTRILALGGSKRRRKFDAVTAAIQRGQDLDGPNSPFDFSRQELRTIQHNLRDLHDRNPSATKHLLLRLTDAAAGFPQSRSLPADMTVEHVLPRKLRGNGHWRHWFPDLEIREQCTESLGNLLLVTKAQNDRAGNHDFAFKRGVYFSSVDTPDVAINEGLRALTEWKAQHVTAREAALMGLIEEVWSFGLAAAREPASPEATAGRRRGRRRGETQPEAGDGKPAY